MLTLEKLTAARAALPSDVLLPPILPHETGWLLAESLQTTGSYKLRAAYHVLQSLTPAEKERGAALTSSGNFAQAFAYAAHRLGVPATVVMMQKTQPFKVERTRRWGAEIVLCEDRFEARFEALEELRARGITTIDHMTDERVLVGHGTVGLDLVTRLEPSLVLVPCSTGGLLAGTAAAVKLTWPRCRVIGVQPTEANAAVLSFEKGEIVTKTAHSQCDALTASRPGELPFHYMQQFVDEMVSVSEEAISEAVRHLAEEAKLVVEPGAAVGIAALRSGVVRGPAATVLSGGNVAPARLAGYLSS